MKKRTKRKKPGLYVQLPATTLARFRAKCELVEAYQSEVARWLIQLWIDGRLPTSVERAIHAHSAVDYARGGRGLKKDE